MQVTATHLIWNAAGRPAPAMGRTTERRKEIRLHTLSEPKECALCGQLEIVGQPLLVDRLELKLFTNWDLFRKVETGWLCGACLYCLKARELRERPWIASPAGLRLFERGEPELVKSLAYPPEPPFVVGVPVPADKGSRHLAIRARVNTFQKPYWAQFGETPVLCDPALIRHITEIFEKLLAAGAKRGEITGGLYRRQVLEQPDVKALEAELRPIRHNIRTRELFEMVAV